MEFHYSKIAAVLTIETRMLYRHGAEVVASRSRENLTPPCEITFSGRQFRLYALYVQAAASEATVPVGGGGLSAVRSLRGRES